MDIKFILFHCLLRHKLLLMANCAAEESSGAVIEKKLNFQLPFMWLLFESFCGEISMC